MDEQLKALLEEADARGYDRKKKEELVGWYLKNQTAAKPAQDTTIELPSYLRDDQPQGPAKPTGTPLTAFAVRAYSGLVDQIPEAIALDNAYKEQARDYDDELVKRYIDEETKAGNVIMPAMGKNKILEAAKQKYFTQFQNPDGQQAMFPDLARKEDPIANKQAIESAYKQAKLQFNDERRLSAAGELGEAQGQSFERQQKTEPFIHSRHDVKNLGSALEYGMGSAGEFAAQIPLSAGTLGTSSKGLERGYAYQEMLENKAAQLGISVSDVVAKGLDKEISKTSNKTMLEHADTVGNINMLLDQLGLLAGAGTVLKPFIAKLSLKILKKLPQDVVARQTKLSLLKQAAIGAAEVGGASVVEGLTERFQELTTMYQGQLALGKTPQEAWEYVDANADRLAEAFTSGTLGSLFLTGGGRIVSEASASGKETKSSGDAPTTIVEKLAEDVAKQEEKVQSVEVKTEGKKQQERDKQAVIDEEITGLEAEIIDEEANIGDDSDLDTFIAKNKDLAMKVKEQELEKQKQKEEKKLQDLEVKELEKTIDERFKEPEIKQPVVEKTTADTEASVNEASSVSQKNLKNEETKEEKPTTSKEVVATETRQEEKPKARRRGKIRKPRVETKVKTPEATIDLETGDVKVKADRGTKQTKVDSPSGSDVAGAPVEEKKKWYWVKGNYKSGFEVTDKRPRTKQVMEPYESAEAASRGIAQLWHDKAAYDDQQAKINPNPNDEAIVSEQQKMVRMFNNQLALKKPSQKLQRLKNFVEKSIPTSKFPEQHQEVLEKAQKEIKALEALNEDRAKVREVKEEKKAVKEATKPKKEEVVVDDVEKQKQDEAKAKRKAEITKLEDEKKEIAAKYADVRDKGGNVVVRAVPMKKDLRDELAANIREVKALEERKAKLKDKAPAAMEGKIARLKEEANAMTERINKGETEINMWDEMDVVRLAEIDKELADMTTADKTATLTKDEKKQFDEATEAGLDEDDAIDFVLPDDSYEMIDAYHGTNRTIPFFSADRIGEGFGAQAHGWGMYFTNKKNIAENYAKRVASRQMRGRPTTYTVQIHSGKTPDQYTYIEYDAPLSAKQIESIKNTLPKLRDIASRVSFSKPYRMDAYQRLVELLDDSNSVGSDIYHQIGSIFEGSKNKDKDASLFLLNEAKIDGITYQLDGVDNYVVFDPRSEVSIKETETLLETEPSLDKSKTTWSDLSLSSFDEMISEMKEANQSPVFEGMVNTMIQIIDAALGGQKPTVMFGTPSKTGVLGQASTKGDKFFLALTRNQPKEKLNATRLHELTHLFEFAVQRLEGAKDSDKRAYVESYQKLGKLYNELSRDLQFEAKRIEGKLDKNRELTPNEEVFLKFYKNEMYGIKNAREMVAESMSNPEFATLLAHISPVVNKNTKGKPTYLEAIYNAVKDMVNAAIRIANQSGFSFKEIEGFDKSYLGTILSIFEDAVTKTQGDGIKVQDLAAIAEEAFGNPDQTAFMEESPKKQADNTAKKALSEKLYQRVLKEGLKDVSEVKSFLKTVEAKMGVEISNGMKAGIVRRFNNHLKIQGYIKEGKQIVRTLLSQPTTLDKPMAYDRTKFGKLLENIDSSRLNQKGQRKYADAIVAFISNDEKGMAKTLPFIHNYTAAQNVKNLIEGGFDFKEFKRWSDKFTLADYANLPTFIAYITKYSNEMGPKLMEAFHDKIAVAHAEAMVIAEEYTSMLSKIALDNNLNDLSFKKINAYGQIISQNPNKPQTIDEKIVDYMEMLQLRKRAAEQKKLQNTSVKMVEEEIEAFQKIIPDLLAGKNPLTEGENKYYDKARELLSYLLPDVRSNAIIAHNEEFTEITDYLPTIPLSNLPVQYLQESDTSETKQIVTKNDDGPSLSDTLHPTTHYNQMTIGQSAFEIKRRGGRGVYYETNIHNVMARYFQSVLFDRNASQEVKILDKMFKGPNRVTLENEMTTENVERLRSYLLEAIKSVRARRPDYSTFTKWALDVKNAWQTAKIGTGGQFFSQFVAMVPAIAAQTGVGNTRKAISLMIEAQHNPEVMEKLQMLLDGSSQIKIRDFFFEKFENVEDVAQRGVGGKLVRWSDKADKWTTKAMTYSDKLAVALNFVAAFYEAGGDPKDFSTWNTKRIAQADLKYNTLQNVSSSLFMAPKLRQRESDNAALMHSAMWSFKSFALNAMMNTWLAGSTAMTGNKEATKLATAHLASAVGFETVNMGVRFAYGATAAGIYAALTGDDFEWPEMSPNELKERLVSVFYSAFFGGLSSAADAMVRWSADALTEIATGEKVDELFTPEKGAEVLSKFAGPYSNILMKMVLDPINMARDSRTGTNVSEERMNKILGRLFAESIILSPIIKLNIPFRGDLAKLINTKISDDAQAKRNADERRKKRRKRKTKNYY